MTTTLTRTRRTAPAAQTAPPAGPDKAVAAALRDVAFVLQMTRKVKAEIVAERRETAAAMA